MRDYTFFEGSRFFISNIYRSERFDVDRLDISWIDDVKPDFVRGLRIIDHLTGDTEMVHGVAADDLIYSLCFVTSEGMPGDESILDRYLEAAIRTKKFLISEQKNTGIQVKERLVH
jgi:hypothetical protein